MSAYPKPDRTRLTPNRVKTDANDTLDIGWAEGVMQDGRPWRAEAWCQDQVTFLTFFFSSLGIEKATNDRLTTLLEVEGLVRFVGEEKYVEGRLTRDDAGHDIWEVVVVVGDDELYVDASPALRPYPQVVTSTSR